MLDLIIITPSIGRDSLSNTIESIKNIKYDNWISIIIFDGIRKNIEIEDDRFIILEVKKLGIKNYAGLVRNKAFDYILKNNIISNFICFVDDDDTLSPYYIHNLNKELEINQDAELIIFRMIETKDGLYQVYPQERETKIKIGKVGISFCIKYNLMKYKFVNDQFEDFRYIKNIESNKHKIILSSYVNYFIKTDYKNCLNFLKLYPRIKINY